MRHGGAWLCCLPKFFLARFPYCHRPRRAALRCMPRSDPCAALGPSVVRSRPRFKWLRGARAADGSIYAIPSNADYALKLHPDASGLRISLVGGPWPGFWKWHGGVLASTGTSTPCRATRSRPPGIGGSKGTVVGSGVRCRHPRRGKGGTLVLASAARRCSR